MVDFISAREYVFGETFLVRAVARQTHRKTIVDRDVHRAFENRVLALSEVKVNKRIVRADFSFACVHTESTADRVTAEQEALRTTQDLGTLNVEQTCYR